MKPVRFIRTGFFVDQYCELATGKHSEFGRKLHLCESKICDH